MIKKSNYLEMILKNPKLASLLGPPIKFEFDEKIHKVVTKYIRKIEDAHKATGNSSLRYGTYSQQY